MNRTQKSNRLVFMKTAHHKLEKHFKTKILSVMSSVSEKIKFTDSYHIDNKYKAWDETRTKLNIKNFKFNFYCKLNYEQSTERISIQMINNYKCTKQKTKTKTATEWRITEYKIDNTRQYMTENVSRMAQLMPATVNN